MAKISIEVAFALPKKQRIISLYVSEHTTIEEAIIHSGIMQEFTEINLKESVVGIFSKIKKLSDIVKENDRIEIYRSLMMDPKEARRARAKKAKK